MAIALAASLSAADKREKVQFRGSTAIELPKPSQSLDADREFRMNGAPSGKSEYDGVAAKTPVSTVAPQLDRRTKELLDKKKNWIFVNPYEMQFDSKTAEFMEGEKGTGLFEHRLMKEEQKSVMEKYLSEGTPESDREMEAGQKPNTHDSHLSKVEVSGAKGRSEIGAGDSNAIKMQEKGLPALISLDKPDTLPGGHSLFDQKPDRSFFGDGRSGRFGDRVDRSESSFSREDIRKEREARDETITRMFQPRGLASGPATRLDPLNPSLDATRQEANPIGARRVDGFLSPGRSANRSTVAIGQNSPIFSSGTATAGESRSFSDRSSFDLNSRASTAATPSIGGGPSPAAVAAPKLTPNPSPFSLPFPQRKF